MTSRSSRNEPYIVPVEPTPASMNLNSVDGKRRLRFSITFFRQGIPVMEPPTKATVPFLVVSKTYCEFFNPSCNSNQFCCKGPL